MMAENNRVGVVAKTVLAGSRCRQQGGTSWSPSGALRVTSDARAPQVPQDQPLAPEAAPGAL